MGRTRRPRRDAAWNPPSKGGDITALFAVLVAVPLLLPLLSRFSFLVFAIPAVTCGVAVPRCLAAARTREPARAWRSVAAAVALASAASVLGVASVFAPGLANVAFYVGAGATAALLTGVFGVARRSLAGAATERLVDALIFDAVVVALGVWFVARPGFESHDPVLTLVFVGDLAALALASAATLAVGDRGERRIGWWLVGACALVCTGDALVALGQGSAAAAVTAMCWALAGGGLYAAAGARTRASAAAPGEDADDDTHWLHARIMLPLVAALAFPIVAFGVWADGGLDGGAKAYFGIFFFATLLLAFGRQAYLLAENHRVAIRERRLRREVVRRNEELEALTALATTMTETLEEDPVVERGLAALRIAARATSMALHVRTEDSVELRASAGEWGTEAPWVTREAPAAWQPGVEDRGGRQIVRLAVAARRNDIGLVTLVRHANDPVTEHELQLLRLLVDQVAIAIQNARDYRDRHEQAIRDPLTGLYNRRFFWEAFQKEVARCERYDTPCSVVVLDVDDFKRVNDTLGHNAGDHVLCEIGRIALEVTRSADSFARTGGEEFALLLPEASQLDALLVAERLRRAVAKAGILADRTITVSAGISSWPDDATTVEELEAKADAALYWAKRNGKNLCAVASEVVVDAESDEAGMLAHLHALVSTIDSEHLNTRDHSENVAAYAVAIGQRLGFAQQRIVRLRRAALFHDIGKIAVRGSVLQKEGALTDDEFAEMATHPSTGASMLLHSGFATEAEWVRHHHERTDGGGYPEGLAGDAIPFEARIIFVADSFEAMTSDRPYRPGMPVPAAVEELQRCAGTQFDPRVVEALCDLLEQNELAVLALREDA